MVARGRGFDSPHLHEPARLSCRHAHPAPPATRGATDRSAAFPRSADQANPPVPGSTAWQSSNVSEPEARPYVVAWRRLTEEDEDRFRTLSRLRRTPMSTWIFARSKKYRRGVRRHQECGRGHGVSRTNDGGALPARPGGNEVLGANRTPRSRRDRLRRLLSRSAITSRRVGRVTWRTASSPSKRRVSPDIPCRSWCDPLSGAAEAVVVGVPASSSVGGQGSAVDGARGSVRLDAPRVG